MVKSLTQEEFVARSHELHDGIYDYSNSEYSNTRTHITIYCTVHDIMFSQLPKAHLLGKTGCPKCKIVRRQQTTRKKYGVSNISQLEKVKEKKRETCFEHFGVYHSLQSPEVREKGKRTNLKNLGVVYPAQSKIVQEKIISTNLDRYGTTCPLQNNAIKEKIKQTNLERLGVEYPMQSKDVRVKSKQTCLKNYGVENIAQSEEIQEKIKQTNLGRYGFECTLQSEEIQEKTKHTNLERYGVVNPMQCKAIKEKAAHTMLHRYGVPTFAQRNYSERTLACLSSPDFLLHEHHFNKKSLQQISKELGISQSTLPPYFKKYGIDVKYFYQSIPEKALLEFIRVHYDKTIITTTRKVIPPYEIDIYLPDINVAIEFNGTYWHSELNGKSRDYHLNKTKLCNERDIHLIHIWEHDWNNKQAIIESMLLSKIGLINNKINARECETVLLDSKTATRFLNENHIQGQVSAPIRYGLSYQNNIVAIMTFSKSRFNKNVEYELVRFCSKININVRGAASKLFNRFVNDYTPNSIVSYSDFGRNRGILYTLLGFEFKHSSLPNFRYFHISNPLKTFSRIKFQKHKLQNQLENYNPQLSAWENMINNGYDRIWDCGNNVYLWNGDK